MEIGIQPAAHEELHAVLSLWEEADAKPTVTDDVSSLEQLLGFDPEALLVAHDGGKVVGSVIAAWDGWRGGVYRLVVAPSHRRRGLGRALVERAELRLAGLGAVRLQAIVVASDARAISFWRAGDWSEQVERARFTKG